jgi:hypothetical protein
MNETLTLNQRSAIAAHSSFAAALVSRDVLQVNGGMPSGGSMPSHALTMVKAADQVVVFY